MILEFYRLSDEKIIELINQPDKASSEYLEKNFASVYGKDHKENDTVFSLDKTWSVIRFLFVQADNTENKIVSELYGESLANKSFGYSFLLSKKVKVINHLVQEIQTNDLFKFYDEVKMENEMVYYASSFHRNYIEKHIEILKLAFEKAANSNSGLIINIS